MRDFGKRIKAIESKIWKKERRNSKCFTINAKSPEDARAQSNELIKRGAANEEIDYFVWIIDDGTFRINKEAIK